MAIFGLILFFFFFFCKVDYLLYITESSVKPMMPKTKLLLEIKYNVILYNKKNISVNWLEIPKIFLYCMFITYIN